VTILKNLVTRLLGIRLLCVFELAILGDGAYEHWLLTEANRALGLGLERKSA
jgi:hypothetical protein